MQYVETLLVNVYGISIDVEKLEKLQELYVRPKIIHMLERQCSSPPAR